MRILFTLIVFTFFMCREIFPQEIAAKVFRVDSLPEQGILLDKGWKFRAGDDTAWAKPGFNDSQWQGIDLKAALYQLPQIRQQGVGWFRITLSVDSHLLNKPLAFQVSQTMASEIYLDGKLIKRYGLVHHNKKEVRAFQPLSAPVGLMFKNPVTVLAVRFAIEDNLPYRRIRALWEAAFQFRINDVEGAGNFGRIGNKFPVLNAVYTGIFLVLTIIHLGLFLLYRRQKANLFFSMATLSGAIANGLFIIIIYSHSISFRVYALLFEWLFLLTFFNLFLFIAVHYLFLKKRGWEFWTVVVYSLGSLFFWDGVQEHGELLAFMLPFWISMLASLIIAWRAYRKNNRDAGIIVVGLAAYLLFYSKFILIYLGLLPNQDIGFGSDFSLIDALYQAGVISVPIALSFYLSRDFAFTSKELESQLRKVQQLSEKTILQEQEKQQLLAAQNETLELQVKERTVALSRSLDDLKSAQAQLIQSEKMASLGEMTAGIAHEIQNPLNFVNNFSEVNKELLDEMKNEIEKGNLDEVKNIANDVIDNHEKINHHGKRADAIVKGMLQHSRSSHGIREPTNVNGLADEYLRLAYHGLRAKDKSFNATLKTDYDENIGSISIVPQDMGRVFLNLLTNAFYSVSEKSKQVGEGFEPTVVVSTKKLDGTVEIAVKDNGTGIPPNLLEKIFQPFFTTKPTGQGTGLGLSLAYDIVKAHGGDIKVKSKEGEGTAFTIVLPLDSC